MYRLTRNPPLKQMPLFNITPSSIGQLENRRSYHATDLPIIELQQQYQALVFQLI